jgi:hypothetical protein
MFSQYERRSEAYVTGYDEMDDKDERERSKLLAERAIVAARIAFDLWRDDDMVGAFNEELS